MTFLESDYQERDPYRKFTVGLAHAFGGTLLFVAGMPFILVIVLYFAKEVIFDLTRVFKGSPSKWLKRIWSDRWLVGDSLADFTFWSLGAAMGLTSDPRYGFAVIGLGAVYFIVDWFNGR